MRAATAAGERWDVSLHRPAEGFWSGRPRRQVASDRRRPGGDLAVRRGHNSWPAVGAWRSGAAARAAGDYEQILLAFERDHQAAIEDFLLELVARLREIRLVEFTFSDNRVTSEKDGPCNRIEFGQRLADLQAWEPGWQRMCPPTWDRPDWKQSTR